MVAEFRGKRSGKRKKPRLTQAQQRAAVLSPDAVKSHSIDDRKAILARLDKEEKYLRRDVPSEPWFDAKWYGGEQFPPGGDLTGMERCRCCDHYMPPIALTARGVCLDCVYANMSPMQMESLPSSHSSVNLAKLKASRKRNGAPYAGGI